MPDVDSGPVGSSASCPPEGLPNHGALTLTTAQCPDPTAVPSDDIDGAMDAADDLYAMAREGRIPHLYRGEIPPSGFIHRLAVCQRVIVDRVAVPSDTAVGRICRWCERAAGDR